MIERPARFSALLLNFLDGLASLDEHPKPMRSASA
jgi:hypothetical protein